MYTKSRKHEMKKFPSPSSLTSKSVCASVNPIRVQTKGGHHFAVSFVGRSYVVNSLFTGSFISFITLKEVKFFISCYL